MANKLEITQIKSMIKEKEPMKRTLWALGVRRMHQSVVHDDTPQIRGMAQRVHHLVTVKEVDK